MKKSTFLPKFHIFCTILTFLHQNLYWQKHFSLCLKVCTTLFYHCAWKFTHLPKNWRFLHKMLFLLKENNATKNWHISKTEDTSLRKLNISFKNWHFWKWWPFATKMKKSFKIAVSARFSLLPVKLT